MEAMSLYGGVGGKKSRFTHVPSEVEGFGLTVACAMQWVHLRNSAHPDFFSIVAQEVKSIECTHQMWAREELKRMFHDCVLGGICQNALKLYLQRKFKKTTTKEERLAVQKDFVQNIIFRFMATAKAGIDHDAALVLAGKSQLGAILQSRVLGGRPAWDVSTMMPAAA
jgi:hypothetical protein